MEENLETVKEKDQEPVPLPVNGIKVPKRQVNRKRRFKEPPPNETDSPGFSLDDFGIDIDSSDQQHEASESDDNQDRLDEPPPKYREVDADQSFALNQFSDEVLYEIFKHLDSWSLMALMTSCDRFHTLVLDRRFWTFVDLSQDPLPLGILEDVLERLHPNTRSVKLRGPSPEQHAEGEIQQINRTLAETFSKKLTKLGVLELQGVTIDFRLVRIVDFPESLQRLIFHECNVVMPECIKTIFSGIDTHLVNLEEMGVEFCDWFDSYYIMIFSKMPQLRWLSLQGCTHMPEFVPYGSMAARFGFKKLQYLDVRFTPIADSDLQCFNAVVTLREILLDCPSNLRDKVEPKEKHVKRLTTTSPAKAEDVNDNEEPSTSAASAAARAASTATEGAASAASTSAGVVSGASTSTGAPSTSAGAGSGPSTSAGTGNGASTSAGAKSGSSSSAGTGNGPSTSAGARSGASTSRASAAARGSAIAALRRANYDVREALQEVERQEALQMAITRRRRIQASEVLHALLGDDFDGPPDASPPFSSGSSSSLSSSNSPSPSSSSPSSSSSSSSSPPSPGTPPRGQRIANEPDSPPILQVLDAAIAEAGPVLPAADAAIAAAEPVQPAVEVNAAIAAAALEVPAVGAAVVEAVPADAPLRFRIHRDENNFAHLDLAPPQLPNVRGAPLAPRAADAAMAAAGPVLPADDAAIAAVLPFAGADIPDAAPAPAGFRNRAERGFPRALPGMAPFVRRSPAINAAQPAVPDVRAMQLAAAAAAVGRNYADNIVLPAVAPAAIMAELPQAQDELQPRFNGPVAHRPDQIIYLDLHNRRRPVVMQRQPRSPPDNYMQHIDQVLNHPLFWDMINPLARNTREHPRDNMVHGLRYVGPRAANDPDLDNDDMEPGYVMRRQRCAFYNRSGSRYMHPISDRGICSFGRPRNPVQQGIIWIRIGNRPSENMFERLTIRNYPQVTDISLQHLVQCSPYLVYLDVSGTRVTRMGVRRFLETKPECEVVATHLDLNGNDTSDAE